VAPNPSSSRMAATSRLFWMLVGPAILSILGILIAENHKGWFAPRSIVFLALLIGVVIARWFDPLDSHGQPTTPRQRQMELAFLIALSLGGWLIANMLSSYWLK
jgi:hypothetical protein